ncbi:MAG: insulinase family protein [Chitinophagaceae bacterium]|nr:insulinase family protein [Chitinophagaceae bacterium]MBK8606321.1 insulinase family protein [Chitinophagaceae bacterium]MBP6477101.1 insulinase family protein [Chitinophagaceae bacterium]MBP7315017.1 insulinase family protein [Chitinophagaceae bacterium]HQX96403.1 pitrilysin family protein [Chitinophagaceae bacterium]
MKVLDRKKNPPIVDAVNFKLNLKPYQKFVLDNGVEVYAVDAGAEEVLQTEWIFSAGNAQEEKNLVAATTNFLLRNGTSTKTAFQINEQFDYYGSYINRACYNETATITLHSLTRHIDNLLPKVRELITDSVMPQEELSIYQQNMKQRLKVSLKKSDFVAGRLIDVYLYGEKHPYGKYSSAEDFDALKREELVDFYKKYYQQGKLIIFVAGKLPQNLEQLLNTNFGDLPFANVIEKETAPVLGTEKKIRITNDPDGAQGSIRIARPFPNRHHPDFLKAQILNALFGGFFGSRLMSNIREDKGYTYGIHSYLLNHVQQSGWLVSTEAGKDVCEATIEEVYKEMKLLRDEPVDAEELLLVRNYMMGSILGDLDGPFQIIARWKNIILNNLDEKYFYDSIETIKTVSAEELQALAQKYLQPDDFYELVVV